MLDDELKKSLYKKIINKQLVQTALSIDGTGTFQTYKVWLMALDNHITQYNNNHKGFLFILVSKPVVLESIIKPVKEEVINWETSVIITNLNQKNTCYIEKEEN